jgi:hypothetical protein
MKNEKRKMQNGPPSVESAQSVDQAILWPIKAALVRILTSEKDADGEKIDPIKRLPFGRSQVKGVALITIEAFLDRAGDVEARAAWPTKDVLAFALALAVDESHPGEGEPDAECRLRELLARAATRCLKHTGDKPHRLVERALTAMEGVQSAMADELPRQPRAGATTVKGIATVTEWRPL